MPSPTHLSNPRPDIPMQQQTPAQQYRNPWGRTDQSASVGGQQSGLGFGVSSSLGGGQGINPDTQNAIANRGLPPMNANGGWDNGRFGYYPDGNIPEGQILAGGRPGWTMRDNRPQDTGGDSTDVGGGAATVGTGTTPAPVFTSGDTQHAVNQAAQQAFKGANMASAMKPYQRPGASSDVGMASLALPQLADASTQAGMAQQTIPIMDEYTNAAALAQGESNLSDEFLGLANILRNQQQTTDYQNQMRLSPLLWQLMNG